MITENHDSDTNEDLQETGPNIKNSLQYYYDSVRRESIALSKDEQGEILEKIKVCENGEEKKKLIETICRANLKLVYKIAKNYSYDENSLIEYIAAGNEGLLKAIEKYKVGKAPFPNYAPIWIKQRILNELYSASLLKVPLWRIKTFIKIKMTVADLRAKNGDPISDKEVATQSGIPLRNVSELRSDVYLTKILDRAADDLDFPILIIDENSPNSKVLSSPPDDMGKFHIKDILNSALEYLTVEQRFVVKAYYGLIDGNHKKLHQIAKVLDRTPERIRQIRNESTAKLKKLLSDSGIDIEDWGD